VGGQTEKCLARATTLRPHAGTGLNQVVEGVEGGVGSIAVRTWSCRWASPFPRWYFRRQFHTASSALYLASRTASGLPITNTNLAQHSLRQPSYSLRDALRSSSQEMTPMWLKEEGIANLSIADIPFSSAKLAQRSDEGGELILESISCPAQANPHSADKRGLRPCSIAFGYRPSHI
jgi:hypothetical protein